MTPSEFPEDARRPTGEAKRRTAYVLQWLSAAGTWEYPGCSREEATFTSREEAESARDRLEADAEWTGAEWRITEDVAAYARRP